MTRMFYRDVRVKWRLPYSFKFVTRRRGDLSLAKIMNEDFRQDCAWEIDFRPVAVKTDVSWDGFETVIARTVACRSARDAVFLKMKLD